MTTRWVARRGAGVVLAMVVLGSAAACGDDPVERYCEEVAEQQTPITEAAAAGPTGLLLALPAFEELRAVAPDDLTAAWSVVVTRISALVEALDEADVDPATYDPERSPEGLDDEQLAAIEAAASGLLTDAVGEALDSVQQQARDVCKTPLSL